MVKRSLDPGHVTDTHRDYAERELGCVSSVLQHERHYGPDLCGRTILLTICPKFLLDEDMRNGRRAAGTGECHQAVLIDVSIREIDQALVSAPVMPVKIRAVKKRVHRVEQ